MKVTDCINYSENLPDVNEPPYRGSYNQLFANNLGKWVKVDFLIGSQTMASQTGVITSVGVQYVLLYQPDKNTYVACDIYSVKFITFLCDRNGGKDCGCR